MKNAKRLKKLMRRSLIDSIARSLHRQAVAAEGCERHYLSCLELQELQIDLSKKSVTAAQEIAHITKQNYADRILSTPAQLRRTKPMTELELHIAKVRLANAAPDLLAVCEAVVASAIIVGEFEYSVPKGIVDRLKAAIAKAKGETP
jgi:hypothetical protein